MARARGASARTIHCYLCGHSFEVTARAMSTSCPGCHKAIKIEDVTVTSYVPVTALETCGRIIVTKKGRVAAKRISAGDSLTIQGVIEGSIRCGGGIAIEAKASWRGAELRCRSLRIDDGAILDGRILTESPES